MQFPNLLAWNKPRWVDMPLKLIIAQSARAVEYTDCTSAEG